MLTQIYKNEQFSKIDELLKEAAQKKASDLHLTVGIQPAFRINGKLVFSEHNRLLPNDTREMFESITNDKDVYKRQKKILVGSKRLR